jgi:RNA-directed DNA polymerase
MNFPRNLFIEGAKSEGHSDLFIENTLNYIDHLTGNNLPVIFSLKHLSLLIGMDFQDLKEIIYNRNSHYSYYLISKKKGGYRRIVAPHSNIKILQNWIKVNILDRVDVSPFATGFIKKRSILTNAKIHENNTVILNVDLSNFFESITEKRVYSLFKSLGYASNLAVDFAKICTAKMSDRRYEELSEEDQIYFDDLYSLQEHVLVQGAPTSPGISNLICKTLDLRLSKLANKLSISYSRYADDITFSSKELNLPKIHLIKSIIEDEGFKLNWNKVGIYKSGQKQLVTGLLIDGRVRVPPKFKKEIYRHLHFCKKFGPYEHFQRISPDKGYRREWLLGKIFYVHSIEPNEAKKMFHLANQINWEV